MDEKLNSLSRIRYLLIIINMRLEYNAGCFTKFTSYFIEFLDSHFLIFGKIYIKYFTRREIFSWSNRKTWILATIQYYGLHEVKDRFSPSYVVHTVVLITRVLTL